jgi:hypothetical protein
MGIVLYIFILRRQISTILNKKKGTVLFEKKRNSCSSVKNWTQEFFFYLVGIDVFSKLFHLTLFVLG